jgi:hypothetical protein
VSALITNAGAFEASVTVRFYPSEPATGLDPTKELTSVSVVVPAGSTRESDPKVPFILPPGFDQPTHICLFVEVSAALDQPDGSGNPNKDHHYAQQNLLFFKVKPGQRLVIPFFAVGGAQPGSHHLSIRRVEVQEDERVPRLTFQPELLGLTDAIAAGGPQERLSVELRRWENHPLQAEVRIPPESRLGAEARLVIEQRSLDGEEETPTGGIGIVLQVAN